MKNWVRNWKTNWQHAWVRNWRTNWQHTCVRKLADGSAQLLLLLSRNWQMAPSSFWFPCMVGWAFAKACLASPPHRGEPLCNRIIGTDYREFFYLGGRRGPQPILWWRMTVSALASKCLSADWYMSWVADFLECASCIALVC